ncbi:DUF6431 domain-containing protein [Paenibacillus sp. V4I5]|nr:DUF6431 domain-containing protein [Paenibacillus sp. V4I5]
MKLLVIRRLHCSQCLKIHHELPDCIVPYKRYESERTYKLKSRVVAAFFVLTIYVLVKSQ